MSRLAVVVTSLTALSLPSAARADDMYELPSAMPFQRSGDPVTGGVTLYLNGGGGVVTAGWDDSAQDTSSIVYNVGERVKVPAWGGGRRKWAAVAACVRDRFADFAVDVVTDRPARGDYIMIMVGGRPSLLGYPNSVGGVAPYTSDVIARAIGFVFSARARNDVETTCLSIVHEAGHAMGLDHAYLCEDPMSYLWGCGDKRFRDEDAHCGESEPRGCGDGEVTQNSYRKLARAVGLRDGRAVEPSPASDEPARDHRDDRDDLDLTAPAVAVIVGDDHLLGNRWIDVVVRATDRSGIAEIELGWASETAEYVWPCSAIPADVPVTCERDGDTFRFQLLAGTGLRAIAARATDHAGNQAVTEVRVIYLADD
jgi:hypothetical protein